MSNVNEIYSLRKSFSIIALTGRMASGCSEVAMRLSQPIDKFKKDKSIKYRDIESIELPEIDGTNDHFSTNLFKRKYTIVQNYVNKNWNSYQIIDYKKVLFLYLLDCIKNDENYEHSFIEGLNCLYTRGEGDVDSDLVGNFDLDPDKLKSICNTYKFGTIITELKKINNILKVKKDDDLKTLYDLFFFSDSFDVFYTEITKYLKSINQYLLVFLFHKLGVRIRQFGTYKKDTPKESITNVYNVVKLINRLIKAYKLQETHNDNCHIVIDSFRNSLEIMFFKERYSAFYMLSIHNDTKFKERIREKIEHADEVEKTQEKIIELDAIEYDSSSFGKGKLFAPDVQNCIQKSEIHIQYNDTMDGVDKLPNDFYLLSEQLIKLQALIQQPGIITPTGIERCMQIAYNSKFNSGCISRQVGAVITDNGLSVKSVGWNDVPQNTIACLFRNTDEISEGKKDIAYSDFESITSTFTYTKNKVKGIDEKNQGTEIEVITNSAFIDKNFAKNLIDATASLSVALKEDGKNCPYCFKSNHNKFEGEKNQVHTRSLHAEENAMLQISKHGGQKLKGGILFTTASPCELCAKKAFQLGISKVYYIDEYPGISKNHVLNNGVSIPQLVEFTGIIGSAFNKLYEPLMAYKDELGLY